MQLAESSFLQELPQRIFEREKQGSRKVGFCNHRRPEESFLTLRATFYWVGAENVIERVK